MEKKAKGVLATISNNDISQMKGYDASLIAIDTTIHNLMLQKAQIIKQREHFIDTIIKHYQLPTKKEQILGGFYLLFNLEDGTICVKNLGESPYA